VAAIFCKEMRLLLSETGELEGFNNGERVMVIDLGGKPLQMTFSLNVLIIDIRLNEQSIYCCQHVLIKKEANIFHSFVFLYDTYFKRVAYWYRYFCL